MQHAPPIRSEIVRSGRSTVIDLPTIAAMVRDGLTIADYTTLALVADQHRMTIAELCAVALQSEVRHV